MHSVSVTLWAGSGGRFVIGVGFFVGASMADRGVLLMLSAQGESEINFKEAANCTKARLDGKEWKNMTIAKGLCTPREKFGGKRVPSGGGRGALRNAHCPVRQDVRSRMAAKRRLPRKYFPDAPGGGNVHQCQMSNDELGRRQQQPVGLEGLYLLSNLGDHLSLVGKLARVELGIEQLVADGQLEASAARGDQFKGFDLLFVFTQQLARQTDGLGLIVSHGAVTKCDLHHVFLRRSGYSDS
jgi:hypothetical protein